MPISTDPSRRRASRALRPGSAEARARNRRIQAFVRRDTPGKLPFFCECGMDYCRSSVWLTLQEAWDLIESGALIIAAHAPRIEAARLDSSR